MEITIPDLIPKGLNFEVFINPDQIHDLVNEELSNDLWRPFMERVLDEYQKDKINDWTLWEGFWSNEEDGTQTELIFGVLNMFQKAHLRGMRVKYVPKEQTKTVQEALKVMMETYLYNLGIQLQNKKDEEDMSNETFTAFGEGKSKKYLCSICQLLCTKEQFGHGFGCNARPINNGRCCDKCDREVVIPARIARMNRGLKPYEGGMDMKVVQGIQDAIMRGEEVPGLVKGAPGTVEVPIEDIRTVENWDDPKWKKDKKKNE
jgi:hypothetical protein